MWGRALCDRDRELTPERAGPADILRLARDMARRQPPFDRVAVGFPGVVQDGVVRSAPNLDADTWPGTDLAHALEGVLSRPVRVVNDADLAGLGVIVGAGTELVLTLGTGMGSALFVDGHLVPNVELGQHPYKKGHSYEDRIGEAARRKVGKKRWRRRVIDVVALLRRTFNPDLIWIGGGNARRLDAALLGPEVRLFEAVAGMRGGVRLWEDAPPFGQR